jgi:hypothetical protein
LRSDFGVFAVRQGARRRLIAELAAAFARGITGMASPVVSAAAQSPGSGRCD